MTTSTPQPYQPAVATYAPVSPRRPPLTKRQKRGAAWGGIVGFNLLTLGFSLFILPMVAALFWSIFKFVISAVSRSLNGSGSSPRLADFAIDWGFWLIPGIIVTVVGLGVMALAILLSRSILKRHEVYRRSGVTWAAAGIAIVGFWALSWIPALFAQVISGALSSARLGWGESLVASAVVVALLALVGNSVIGWLSWWWMAHALRGDTVVAPATAAVAMAAPTAIATAPTTPSVQE